MLAELLQSNLQYKVHQIRKLKQPSSLLAVVFAQSIEAKMYKFINFIVIITTSPPRGQWVKETQLTIF